MGEQDSAAATVGFRPAPRLPPPGFATADITVAAPPEVSQSARPHLMARLMPVVMAAAAVGMALVVLMSGSGMARSPMFAGFPLLMLVSAVTSAVTGQDRRRSEINTARADYLGYLGELRAAVVKTAAAQALSLTWCHPQPNALWTLVGGHRMWERRSTDSDFCQLRIGLGTQRLATRLVVPRLPPVDRLDPVTATALRRFLHTHSTVPDVPIAVALRDTTVVTIAGPDDRARALLRAMLCQLAVFHSPAAVLIIGVVSAGCRAQWDWLKWLPHNRHPGAVDELGAARMVYPTLAAAETALGSMLLDRPPAATLPRLVIVIDGDVVDGSERVLAGPGIAGVTILATGTGDLAAGAGVRLRVSAEHLAVADEAFAHPDRMSMTAATVCARRLAAYHADRRDAAAATSTGGRGWPELSGVGDPAAFEPTAVWDALGRRERLRVPIGTTALGVPVELDIKEAAEGGMGPHGLCVGATGSGKSEFLRTVALGMIARHSPETLNLVLVDFKGGATFLDLEPAPHVAAVITNLADEAVLVARMRDALLGEMTRRQGVLRAAGNIDGVNAYRRARQAGAPWPALPTLFIIVDEFSELLSQQPDFADVFVAIGRLGRSLGIHLLLASQRLDEGRLRGLESHLSYRVCLKTLSAGESRIVLGTPDAYELPNVPGAGYLRTGTAEAIRFHTAYVSAPCPAPAGRPVCGAPRDAATSVRAFTAEPAGRVVADDGHADTVAGTSVLHTVVQRVCGYGPPAHSIWLPPLGSAAALDEVLGAAGPELTVAIGLVDRPFEQRRAPLVVDLSGSAGNVAVVGAPVSGKSTALRTLITALAATHHPSRVQFYCLDFGGGALNTLASWPHVGSVATRADPELARRILAALQSLRSSRESAFRAHGIASMADYRRLKAQQDPVCDRYGDVFVVVDGWAASCRECDALEAAITDLAAHGLSFGIHVAVSATRWAELRPALKDQLGTRIELRLGDPADSELDRRRALLVPEGQPGRGLSRDGLHMLVALPRLDGVSSCHGLAEAGGQIGELLRRRYPGSGAPAIPLLPARVDYHALLERAADDAGLLLGLEESELHVVAIDVRRHPHLLVLGANQCGKTNTLRTVCREIVRTVRPGRAQVFVVDFRRTLLGVVESRHLGGYAASPAALQALLPDLVELVRKRLPPARITQQQLRDRSWWTGPDVYLVVDDYDLVGTAGGNPLAAIAEFLPQAGDLGLHLVVARRSGGAAHAMFEPLLAGLRDFGCLGLLMSANPEDGPLFGGVPAAPLPAGRGVLLTGGSRQVVQVAWSAPG
ncbi:type VII secretion protein EccCa [Mycobacterium sp.]|uniref:type VII secretion protein EccCa n=1 Tax=Mycobacterium sp. TaxID=1785 RepID=UPI00127090E5|nr:type VII secretion protein EccCa [Mycobacterium sp.]KAA8966123.1 MAG: type VII secretion protein EccCa [Mycobacterium sp.]